MEPWRGFREEASFGSAMGRVTAGRRWKDRHSENTKRSSFSSGHLEARAGGTTVGQKRASLGPITTTYPTGASSSTDGRSFLLKIGLEVDTDVVINFKTIVDKEAELIVVIHDFREIHSLMR